MQFELWAISHSDDALVGCQIDISAEKPWERPNNWCAESVSRMHVKWAGHYQCV